jgi:FtsP/CotA-like multicopper oxidase with cupredoxin domain
MDKIIAPQEQSEKREKTGQSMKSSSTSFSRRTVLKYGGMGAGMLLLSSCMPFSLSENASTSQARPSFPRAASTGQTRTYTLEAAPTTLTLGKQQVSTWAYNGRITGPELRLTEGDTLQVMVKNRLPQGTSIHWHGVPLLNAMDGVPGVTQQEIATGQEFEYRFLAPTAGTFFYHPHVGVQLDQALYGPLIIESAREAKNYDQDYVLLLDDWLDGLQGTPEDAMKRLTASGDHMGHMGHASQMGVPPDIIYPLYLINGHTLDQPFELQATPGDRLRLRLINASSSTIYHLALQGHRLTVTHTDGQPVVPVVVDTLRIGMGERYDVLVTMKEAGVWQMAAKVEGADGMARAILRSKGNNSPLPPAGFQPSELKGQQLTYAMLKAADGLVVPPAGDADTTLPIQLGGGMGRYVWTINGKIFTEAEPFAVQKNRLIRFEFDNQSMMPHPMHLHGHFFQIETGTGQGPLKDTVIIDPMQKLTVNWISDNPGTWAFHCHNIYHAETGMMQVIRVT